MVSGDGAARGAHNTCIQYKNAVKKAPAATTPSLLPSFSLSQLGQRAHAGRPRVGQGPRQRVGREVERGELRHDRPAGRLFCWVVVWGRVVCCGVHAVCRRVGLRGQAHDLGRVALVVAFRAEIRRGLPSRKV